MKKLFFIAGFAVALSFTACSNNDGNKTSVHTPATISPDDKPVSDGKVVHLNVADFKKLVWDYTKNPDNWVFEGDLPLIIDFYADWCRPCKLVAPIMDELAQEYSGKIRVYKINTEVEKELASVFNIRSIPAVLFVPKEGKPQMSVGALPKPTFEQAIKEVLLVK